MRYKVSSILIGIILLLAFVFRLYRLDNPVADWHSWRQADTSAVSRNFVFRGYDILHPRFDDLSNVASGKDNPEGYRFVEFPIYNILQAGSFQLFGLLSLEEWGRLITIISSLGSIIFLYLLVRKYISERAGLLTAFFYAFLPYNIYYGRVILPDPSMVTAFLGAIYFFDKWIGLESKSKNQPAGMQGKELWKRWMYFVLSLLFAALSLLLKPYAIFFLLPIGVLAMEKFGVRMLLQWKLWVFAIISVLPLIAWRLWMTHYPEGIPANSWLLNGNGIRFRPAFFRWIGYERVSKLILGYSGVLLLLLGSFFVVKKKQLFLGSFILSSLLYVCTFATGNVQHDYYQILIMPSLAILCGLGAEYLLSLGKNSTMRLVTVGSLVFITVSMFFFAGKIVKDYFNINNRSIIVAGNEMDKIAPKNAKIIALYDGDTSFLYQTKRQGWASLEKPLPEMVSMGADYLILANPTEKDLYFSKNYKIIAQTKEYLIYDLHKRP